MRLVGFQRLIRPVCLAGGGTAPAAWPRQCDHDVGWVSGPNKACVPGRRGNSISGLAKAVSSKLSSGKGGGAGNSKTGFTRFDDGQHGVELGGNGYARGAAL